MTSVHLFFIAIGQATDNAKLIPKLLRLGPSLPLVNHKKTSVYTGHV